MNPVKKYTPLTIDECTNSRIRDEMCSWLTSWEGKKKVDSIKNGLLLHGPSGVGKTLYARLLLKKFGYNEILYLSTNDIRTYSRLTKKLDKLTKTFTFLSFTGITIKKAIIFDEIEGVGNSDKGCMKKLIEILYPRLSKTKQKMSNITKYSVPIICITNNINDSKSNKIKKYCTEVGFTLPGENDIRQILQKVKDDTGNELMPVEAALEMSQKYKFDFNMLGRFLEGVYDYKLRENRSTITAEDIRDFKHTEASGDVLHSRFLNSDMYKLSRRIMTEPITYNECYDYYNAFPSILQYIVYDNLNVAYSKIGNEHLDDIIENLDYQSHNNMLDSSMHDDQFWFLNDYTSVLYLKKANEICSRVQLPIEKITFSTLLNKNSKTLYTHKIIKELLRKIGINNYNLTLIGSILIEHFLKLGDDTTYLEWFKNADIIGSLDKFTKFNLFQKEYDGRITNKYKKSILKLM